MTYLMMVLKDFVAPESSTSALTVSLMSVMNCGRDSAGNFKADFFVTWGLLSWCATMRISEAIEASGTSLSSPWSEVLSEVTRVFKMKLSCILFRYLCLSPYNLIFYVISSLTLNMLWLVDWNSSGSVLNLSNLILRWFSLLLSECPWWLSKSRC